MRHRRLMLALIVSLSVHVPLVLSFDLSENPRIPHRSHFIEIGLVETGVPVASLSKTLNHAAASQKEGPEASSADATGIDGVANSVEQSRKPKRFKKQCVDNSKMVPSTDIVDAEALDVDELILGQSEGKPHAQRDATSGVAPFLSVPSIPVASTEPQPLSSGNPSPHYPGLALRRGWEGQVVLRVWVCESGLVRQVEVVDSSGYSLLDQSAVNAVKRWRFTPAFQGDTAVEAVVQIPVRFELRRG